MNYSIYVGQMWTSRIERRMAEKIGKQIHENEASIALTRPTLHCTVQYSKVHFSTVLYRTVLSSHLKYGVAQSLQTPSFLHSPQT